MLWNVGLHPLCNLPVRYRKKSTLGSCLVLRRHEVVKSLVWFFQAEAIVGRLSWHQITPARCSEALHIAPPETMIDTGRAGGITVGGDTFCINGLSLVRMCEW